MRGRAWQAIRAVLRRRIAFEVDLLPVAFENLPASTVANWLRTEISAHVRPTRPWGMPTLIQVEPTNRCNVGCRTCPASGAMNRQVGDMDVRLFERLVDELAGTMLVMLFWDWGEPFLHPEACRMIRYATDAGGKVLASTNGHVLGNSDYARRVIDSGLYALTFSIDGLTQDSYRRFRTGGSLARALDGVRAVVAAKHATRSPTPLVNLRFIVMRHNQHELATVEDTARSLGVDVLTIRKFHAAPDPDGRLDAANLELEPTDPRHQLPPLVSDGRPRRAKRNPCRNLWNCPTVHWDGSVCSCFVDFAGLHPLGSLASASLREIWAGRPYQGLRRRFRASWTDLPSCGRCSYGWEGGDVGREANLEALWLSRPPEA